MSITFTQTKTMEVEFGINEFRVEFDQPLKNAAKAAGAPYKTEEEQYAFDEAVWEKVVEEVGDEYDMNEEGDADDDEDLSDATASFAIRGIVMSQIDTYVADCLEMKEMLKAQEAAKKVAEPKVADDADWAALRIRQRKALMAREAIQKELDDISAEIDKHLSE